MKTLKLIAVLLLVSIAANIAGDIYEALGGSPRGAGNLAGSIYVCFLWYMDVKRRKAKVAEAVNKTIDEIEKLV